MSRHPFPWLFPVLFVVAAAMPGQDRSLTGCQETDHFEICYRPGSRAGAAVDRIAAMAERELRRICSQLGVPVAKPKEGRFQLFLYDDLQDLSLTTGVKGTGGYSSGRASHIPHDNDQTRYHEMVHIVACNLLPREGKEKRNLFFAEGLANACLEFVHGVPVHAVAKYYRRKNLLPALEEMIRPPDFYKWLRANKGFNAYDVAGSYLRFLLDRYGPARTTRYYTGVSARQAFGVSTAQLEKLWHEALDRFPMRPELQVLLELRHQGKPWPQRAAGLPAEILGRPSDWRSLMNEELHFGSGSKWQLENGRIVGTSRKGAWSVCEMGETKYRDCVVRATIRTERPTPIQIRLGDCNQAMVVNGTFVYRGRSPVAHSPKPAMNGDRKETDLVLVRRAGKLQVWVDGRLVLKATADDTPQPVGLGFHQGRVVFENVRVRELR